MLKPSRSGRVIETEVQAPFGKDRVKIFSTDNEEVINLATKYARKRDGVLSGLDIEKLYNLIKSDNSYRTANITLQTIATDVSICKKGDRE
jgi:hypothetical protein